jgi:hypothetical protein
MKKLFRLSVLTIASLCANYFSTLAQDEQKAFNEGDKIISVGISGGGSSSGYSKLTPSISFDYGLKGTRGIVSIGGFLSYSNTNYNNWNSNFYQYYTQPITKDSMSYSISNYSRYNQHTITAGLRLGLHYATRKWDLYAGTLIGYRQSFTDSRTQTTEYYKGAISQNGGFMPPNGKLISSEASTIPGSNYGQIVFSPYVGARYYVTKKVSLNLEIGQHTGNIGVGFKF